MADLTVRENERSHIHAIARSYKEKGYEVLAEPQGHQLPEFLRPFQPDLIAHKAHKHIVVAVKSRGQCSRSSRVNELAQAVRKKADWKFELVLLGPENSLSVGQASPLTIEEVRSKMLDVASFLHHGYLEAAFLIAWSLAEATLRTLAVNEGMEAAKASPAYLLKHLTYEGIIPRSTYRHLMQLQQTRNAISHGFKPLQLTVETVQELIDLIDNILLPELDNASGVPSL